QGFFRRSIQQNIQYKKCLKNENCSIVRINRNRCQQCRFKKCLLVGMSRDGELGGTLVTSRAGDSLWGWDSPCPGCSSLPEMYPGLYVPSGAGYPCLCWLLCLSHGCVPSSWDPPPCVGLRVPSPRTRSPRAQSCMSPPGMGPPWPGLCTPTHTGSPQHRGYMSLPWMCPPPPHAQVSTSPHRICPPIFRALCPLQDLIFPFLRLHVPSRDGFLPCSGLCIPSKPGGGTQPARGSPRCPLTPGHPQACPMNSHVPGRSGRSVQEIWEVFSLSFTPAVREVVEFAKHIPGFQALSQHDQVTLLKAGTFEVLMVRFASLFDVKEQTVTFMSRTRYGLEELWAMGMGDLLGAMFDFSEKLSALELSDEELGLFTAVVLVSADRSGMEDTASVEQLQETLLRALRALVLKTRPAETSRFTKLLLKLPDLRTLNNLHSEKLLSFRIE
ncbi:Nuclear receptor subfamily 1 group D member 1, partial [Corvus brachyrhynchos]